MEKTKNKENFMQESSTITNPSTTTKTITVGDFFTPDCPYYEQCTSKGLKCNSYKYNKRNQKRDYYEPYIPYPPWIYPTIKPYCSPPMPTVTFV